MEDIILSELFENKVYARKVIPYLKTEYFESFEDKAIFSLVRKYIGKYRSLPTYNVIKHGLSKSQSLNEDHFESCVGRVDEIEGSKREDYDLDWLVDMTESFCQDTALENAIVKGMEILQEKREERYTVKDLITQALQIEFDNRIGIDFFDEKDIDQRWELYHKDATKFPCGLSKFDECTGGGIEPKTLTCLLGDTHIGKTMALVSIAKGYVQRGYDVLYVTLEMAEEKISQRVEANILSVEINNIGDMEEKKFKSNLIAAKQKGYGRLIVKEFPTSGAGVSHIRRLLDDLKLKKRFVPQIIVVDYINIMKSDRYNDSNLYITIKAIAEELRGLAVEGKFAIITATQTNRQGAESSDISMTDVAESYGLPQTVDCLIAIMSPDQLEAQNIQLWKSLKNRLAGIVGWKWPIKTEFEFGRIKDLDTESEATCGIINSEKTQQLVNKYRNKKRLSKIKVNIDESDLSDFDDFMED
jgi:replicative DNA helicase